jgi:hypothetical protein
MFVPIEQAAWPTPGEVRDLRVSLNAPVLLGPGTAPEPTRAALGWVPSGEGAVVRLWLRADGAPEAPADGAPAAVRGFDLPEAPRGPAARASALERAERFLAGLGFLFADDAADATGAGADPTGAEAGRNASPGGPSASLAPGASNSRTSDPDPAAEPGAAASAAAVATAVRADVRLTQLRRRGPAAVAGPPGPAGGIDR